jgi:hypothetical protein
VKAQSARPGTSATKPAASRSVAAPRSAPSKVVQRTPTETARPVEILRSTERTMTGSTAEEPLAGPN